MRWITARWICHRYVGFIFTVNRAVPWVVDEVLCWWVASPSYRRGPSWTSSLETRNNPSVSSFTKNHRRFERIRSNHIDTSLVQNVHPCASEMLDRFTHAILFPNVDPEMVYVGPPSLRCGVIICTIRYQWKGIDMNWHKWKLYIICIIWYMYIYIYISYVRFMIELEPLWDRTLLVLHGHTTYSVQHLAVDAFRNWLSELRASCQVSDFTSRSLTVLSFRAKCEVLGWAVPTVWFFNQIRNTAECLQVGDELVCAHMLVHVTKRGQIYKCSAEPPYPPNLLNLITESIQWFPHFETLPGSDH